MDLEGDKGKVPQAPDQESKSRVPRASSIPSYSRPRPTAHDTIPRHLPYANASTLRTTTSSTRPQDDSNVVGNYSYSNNYTTPGSSFLPRNLASVTIPSITASNQYHRGERPDVEQLRRNPQPNDANLHELHQSLSRVALDDVFDEGEDLTEQGQQSAEGETKTCLFTRAWKSLTDVPQNRFEPASIQFGDGGDNHYEAILNACQHVEKLQMFTSKAIGTCWLRDILQQDSISFDDHGLTISNSALFESKLFSDHSMTPIPAAWIARHSVLISPHTPLDELTEEQRDAIGLSRATEQNLGLQPHTRLRDLTREQRHAIGFTHGTAIRFPHELIRDLTEDQQIEFGLTGLVATMQLMCNEGFCNGDASIVVQDQQRQNVAVVNKIDCRELHLLGANWLQREESTAGRRYSVIANFLVTRKLSHFGIGSAGHQHTIQQKLKAYIRLCALALVSYTGSHCVDFRRLVWPTYELEEKVAASSTTTAAVFQQMPLACLADDIGNPVFIFRTGTRVPQALSLYLADYIDLWGPVWVRRSTPTETNKITAVHTEKGMFYRQETPAPYALADELTCHWVPTKLRYCGGGQNMLALLTQETLPSVPLTFCSDARLLLGHPSVQTENSTASISIQGLEYNEEGLTIDQPNKAKHEQSRTDSTRLGFVVNFHCPLTYADLARCRDFESRMVDTEDSHRVPDQFTVGFNLGHYASVTDTRTYKQNPARTKKDSILSRCKVVNHCIPRKRIVSSKLVSKLAGVHGTRGG